MSDRIALRPGDQIEVSGRNIVMDQLIGEGSTCLAYEGRIVDADGVLDRHVIVKELYPAEAGEERITRRGSALSIPEEVRRSNLFQLRRKQFEASAARQKHLSNNPRCMEIMVQPECMGTFGDTTYLISDMHQGTTLEGLVPETPAEALAISLRIMELFEILSDAGYLMLDVKPSNLLWVGQTKNAYLFDADSVVRKDDLPGLSIEDLYVNTSSLAPEVRYLLSSWAEGWASPEDISAALLDPSASIYSLGRLILGLLDHNGELSGLFDSDQEADAVFISQILIRQYPGAFGTRERALSVAGLLIRLLADETGGRFADFKEAASAIREVLLSLQAGRLLSRRETYTANLTQVAFHLLETCPLWQYARREKGGKIIDVAIFGSHPLREELLKAMIPCTQLLDSRLIIRLIAEDAESFWMYFTSENENPALAGAVNVFREGEQISAYDPSLVRGAAADIYLVREESAASLIDFGMRPGARSFFLLSEKEESNQEALRAISENASRRRMLALSITPLPDETLSDLLTASAIPTAYLTASYDERRERSRAYRMGLAVHAHYMRMQNPRVTMKEIEDSFRESPYNQASSIRSALSGRAYMESVGINPGGRKAAERFAAFLAEAEAEREAGGGEKADLLDDLIDLEHKSWTAFLVLHGAVPPEKGKAFEDWVYLGGNDWKDKSDPDHLIHPCLVSSRPGNRLSQTLISRYKNLSESDTGELDGLEKMTLDLYRCIREEIIPGRRNAINACLGAIRGETGDKGEGALFAEAMRNVFAGGDADAHAIRALRARWENSLIKAGLCSRYVSEQFSLLDQLLRPVYDFAAFRDFKDSDRAQLLAAPAVLAMTGQLLGEEGLKVTVLRPVKGSLRDNLLGADALSADDLVLLSDREEEAFVLTEQAASYFRLRGSSTRIRRAALRTGHIKSTEGILLLDATGLTEREMKTVLKGMGARDVYPFCMEGGAVHVLPGGFLAGLLKRELRLSVEEALFLEREQEEASKISAAAALTDRERTALVHFVDSLSEDQADAFREMLLAADRDNKQHFSLNPLPAEQGVETIPLEGETYMRCGLASVLKTLAEEGFVTECEEPDADDYGPVRARTAAEGIPALIAFMAEEADAHPDRVRFSVEIRDETVLLTEDTLYVTLRAADGKTEILRTSDGQTEHLRAADGQAELLRAAGESLSGPESQALIKNLRLKRSGEVLVMSFRYASRTVREAMMDAAAAAEARLVEEALADGGYDDFRIGVSVKKTGSDIEPVPYAFLGTKGVELVRVKACM